MTITAKMKCEAVEKHDGDSPGSNEVVTLRAVTADTEENKAWSKYTPSGSLTLTISNPDAQGAFSPGGEYLVTIDPA